MSASNTPQAALLAALQAIVSECKTFAYDHDSYLPAHLIEAAEQAIALAEGGAA